MDFVSIELEAGSRSNGNFRPLHVFGRAISEDGALIVETEILFVNRASVYEIQDIGLEPVLLGHLAVGESLAKLFSDVGL